MGIKGLNQLLQRFCGTAHLSYVPIVNFAGKKVAVDATHYMYVFKVRADFKLAIVEFLTLLRENGIHPFFVFDGVAPPEKQQERAHRAEKRAHQRERIKNLELDLEVYKQTNEMSTLLQSVSFRPRKLSAVKVHPQVIQEYIDKLKLSLINITDEDLELMKSLLDAFGIAHVTADGEGEFLCAALGRHGLVDAVMTADTDVLPCLAPTVINKIKDGYFQVVSLDAILSELDFTPSQFIDLCILCGTDFNQNIHRIAAIGAHSLISTHKSIDNIPHEGVAILNHKRVRQLFSYTDSVPAVSVSYCNRVNYQKLGLLGVDADSVKQRLTKRIIKPGV